MRTGWKWCVIACLLTGCVPVSRQGAWTAESTKPPTVSATVPQQPSAPIAFNQTGAAAGPAKVDKIEQVQSIIIPAGTEVTITMKPTAEAKVTTNTTTTSITGPTAFVPPAPPVPPLPPTPSEISDGRMALVYGVAIFIGSAAAIFGLVRGWNLVMYGGAAVAGAGIVGRFLQNHPWLMIVIAIGGTLAIVGPIIWHTKLKHLIKE